MGVNLFIPVNKADASPAHIEALIDAANAWGMALDAFDWCDAFKGDGGALLTMAQAQAFEAEAAPWFVMTVDNPAEFFALPPHPKRFWQCHETEFYWCTPAAQCETSQISVADWQGLLRDTGCDSVLFCKARN